MFDAIRKLRKKHSCDFSFREELARQSQQTMDSMLETYRACQNRTSEEMQVATRESINSLESIIQYAEINERYKIPVMIYPNEYFGVGYPTINILAKSTMTDKSYNDINMLLEIKRADVLEVVDYIHDFENKLPKDERAGANWSVVVNYGLKIDKISLARLFIHESSCKISVAYRRQDFETHTIVQKSHYAKEIERNERNKNRCKYCGCLVSSFDTHCKSCGAPI